MQLLNKKSGMNTVVEKERERQKELSKLVIQFLEKRERLNTRVRTRCGVLCVRNGINSVFTQDRRGIHPKHRWIKIQ